MHRHLFVHDFGVHAQSIAQLALSQLDDSL